MQVTCEKVPSSRLRGVCIEYIGVVSVYIVYIVYNCVYYCDTCYLREGPLFPTERCMCIIIIGVVSMYMQYMVYKCVYY
jgi:hypothetical protein